MPRNTRVGSTCTLIFFHVRVAKLWGVQSHDALYAKKPLTKKKRGIRKSTRKGREAESFSDSANPVCATW